jgi:hypothetical protein
MSYTEWLRTLEKLPKTAEFCLSDVTERISAGENVINFLITENVGQDIEPGSRRGRTRQVCRPRMFVGLGLLSLSCSQDDMTEIKEPLADVEKYFVRNWEFSLHDFYVLQSRLCESALASLTNKIAVISESSVAVLESQLGNEVVKLITKKLSGEAVEEAGLKQLMQSQLASAMYKNVVHPVMKLTKGDDTIKNLSIMSDPIYWEYTRLDPNSSKISELRIAWKGIQLAWDGTEGQVQGNSETFCVRDMFLFMVNLPSFGEIIAAKLEKILK